MSENFYEDWPVEGPRTMLWMAKNIERTAIAVADLDALAAIG